MTIWTRGEPSAGDRECTLNIATISTGVWAPAATDFTGKVFVRLGGDIFVAASGTLTNTGYDGSFVYVGTQDEASASSNEIEVRIIDSTYFGQAIVVLRDNYGEEEAEAPELVTEITFAPRVIVAPRALKSFVPRSSIATGHKRISQKTVPRQSTFIAPRVAPVVPTGRHFRTLSHPGHKSIAVARRDSR